MVCMAFERPLPCRNREAKKKAPPVGTGGAKSLKRSEPSRRAGNGGDGDYDGNCDHGNVGAARGGIRRAVEIHLRAVKKADGRRSVKRPLRWARCWLLSASNGQSGDPAPATRAFSRDLARIQQPASKDPASR